MKVKVILEGEETKQEAEALLLKALASHENGDAHDEASFEDPAMADLANRMSATYKTIYTRMLEEINDVLEESQLTNGN